MKASSIAAVGGIAAVGDIAAVGEWARNFVLGLHAPLLQSFIVSRGLDIFFRSPFDFETGQNNGQWCHTNN